MKKLKRALWCKKYYIILFTFLTIYVLTFTKFINLQTKYQLEETNISGKITNLSINGDKLSLTIKGREKVIANYYFKTEKEKNNILNEISLGDDIILNGEFIEPLNNTIPNTFNYKKYLNNKKIFYTFNVSSFKIEKKSNNLIYIIKDRILKRSYQLDNSDYFLVFLLGDKNLLDGDDYLNYQINGTSHLLAVSGMHVGIIIGALVFILRKFNDKISLFITILTLIFFMFLTGFGASVIRACLFYILNRLNKTFKWQFSSKQLLFFTASIIIIINPFMIYDLGFIYSFVICGGILYYQEAITGNYFTKLFKLSLISFLFSLPISASTNYEINILSVFINLLFVPLISLVVYPLSLITFFCPYLNKIFSELLNICNVLNIWCAHFKIMINIPKMSFILIIIYYIFLMAIKFNKKNIWGLILIIILVKALPLLNNSYKIYFLDVSQGDSAILVSPHLKDIVMIDTGGKIVYEKKLWQKRTKNYNLSDNTIKFLKSLGITRIDYLIISHGDADHAGEAINIINSIKVKKVIFNCGTYNSLEKNLIKVLNNKRIEYSSCINELNVLDSKLLFLNTKEFNNENDNSSVVYANINDFKLLFMGDASKVTEEEILNKYKLSNIDVLKVGHHGSKTSSSYEFINKVKPKYSIISVGKNNRYGHPNKEALDNLKDSKIYRTDIDGSIIFKIKKNKLDIETCPP